MGLLTLVREERAKIAIPSRVLCCSAVALYVLVVALAISRHEPWTDEAHSWLLARDAGLWDLWTRLMHYEGSPGLWQTLLHILIRLGLPYAGLNVISGLLGVAAAILVVARAPLPLGIRLALPLTFFLGYQYSVVARSYVLLPVLLFVCAALWRDARLHLAELTAALCLMAAVSAHGFVLSVSLWVALYLTLARRWSLLERSLRRRLLTGGAVYVAVLVLAACSAWPSADGVFVTRPDLSLAHLLQTGEAMFRGAFTGEPFSTAAAVALSMPLLWRGRGLLPFVLSASMLCAIAGFIYSQVWHQGLLFLAWLFAVWISADRMRPDPAAIAALALVILPQCYWTFESIRYDWIYPYSGSRAVAQFLRENNLDASRLFAVGYACTGVQPYFDRNIFANVNGGGPTAYWDWSVRNHVNQDSEHLDRLQPDYVLVGYKGDFERDLWTRSVRRSGYQPIRHFGGNLFWKTRILEPEAFDLYKRPTPQP
jgi:hypothetical protein